MCNDNRLVRFDWAMKRLLRDKANFGVLEGFLTSLLGVPIKIDKILESESNRETAEQKMNRVDILAETPDHTKVLIEVQNQSEWEYFHRILFGTSRIITDYVKIGESYQKIPKIYSISIVYFDFRLPDDEEHVFVGHTEFIGMHTGMPLVLPERWRDKLRIGKVGDIFPTYYLLAVDGFDRWSATPLDQWMYFLSHGRVPDDATAPGLDQVREKLRIDALPEPDRRAYLSMLDDRRSMMNSLAKAKDDGLAEGIEKGLAIGREEGMALGREEGMVLGREEGMVLGREEGMALGREEGMRRMLAETVTRMRDSGFDNLTIARILGLSPDAIKSL